jgi:hypothetical protein
MNDPKNCTINVWNEHGWDLDEDMLQAVMTRIARHVPNAHTIDVYPQERRAMNRLSDPGMLEWIIRVLYRSGGQLTIGAIQRSPGVNVEFHS